MRAHRLSTYCAIVLPVLLSVPAQGVDSPSEQCPGAASWSRNHPTLAQTPHSKRDGNTAISDAALLNDLKLRVESDQAARRKLLADPKSAGLNRTVDAIDAANLTRLRTLISEKGFPTAAQIGSEGVHLAWVLLQHADQDPNLQRKLLPVLEQRFSAGELPANDLARFTDRVLVASGKPQRYSEAEVNPGDQLTRKASFTHSTRCAPSGSPCTASTSKRSEKFLHCFSR
jgi:uncharacterized protein DUF6624